MRSSIRRLAVLCLSLIAGAALAAPQVRDARVAEARDRVQLILDLSEPARYTTYFVDQPPQVVIDLPDAEPSDALKDRSYFGKSKAIRSIRGGKRQDGGIRLIVRLDQPARPSTWLIPAADGKPDRLVIEMPAGKAQARGERLPDIDFESSPRTAGRPAERAPQRLARAVRRDIVIAIDPGHGGKDTGAIGLRDVREKDVVLAIGRRLATLIDREPGMRAVMTRRGDTFLPLRSRMSVARKQKADLFISIHADSAPNGSLASGSSVYVLSTRGASSEAARWLADRENASDMAGGLRLAAAHDREIASVLLDMSQGASMESSLDLGKRVLNQLDHIGPLHSNSVERAAFAVLKSPDIPSILIETAYLSNPAEESRLASDEGQRQLAQAIMDGIRGYYRNRLPHSVMVADTDNAPRSRAGADRDDDGDAAPAARPAVARAVSKPEARKDTLPKLTLTSSGQESRAGKAKVKPDAGAKPASRNTPAPAARPASARPAVAQSSASAAARNHVVQRGESLQDIARQYRLPVTRLLAMNRLPSNQLRVPAGTTLVVPGS
ncbi:N-acetylmuramoyl-L-alanine amidase [Plasticicumulans sp.]|uniref:N-acetylmuramoyl-L-alanine amidase n=1 Tax=Plasticicumulans sp. TaxID=2307179 RepID=UPI002B9B745E|nr:N-acetylmuramoyl-L-alanine amidase [Plasticicumulans sp.]HNM42410.1 N-acetylmuramoyl-L-alanine amidase [Plasticicumulans sp.]HNO61906.1 N-acetylmuramoyl-L-alanine amidase [Plasticicumulans sp.]